MDRTSLHITVVMFHHPDGVLIIDPMQLVKVEESQRWPQCSKTIPKEDVGFI